MSIIVAQEKMDILHYYEDLEEKLQQLDTEIETFNKRLVEMTTLNDNDDSFKLTHMTIRQNLRRAQAEIQVAYEEAAEVAAFWRDQKEEV